MKRRTITVLFVGLFLVWNVITYMFLAARPAQKDDEPETEPLGSRLMGRLKRLEDQLMEQRREREQLQLTLKEMQLSFKQKREAEAAAEAAQAKPADPVAPDEHQQADNAAAVQKPAEQRPLQDTQRNVVKTKHKVELPPTEDTRAPDDIPLPVLVIACNRVTVNLNLDQLLDYRPDDERFPIIVSQDCGHEATARVIQSYGDRLTHIQHPNTKDIQLPPKEKKFKDYYKIARHYKWAINQVFHRFNHSAVIIVEDDLNISEDFFEYFAATFRILRADPTLWCVSAWNDNGKGNTISSESELLYRTDFFPGLGWMMERKTWLELESKWPDTFWDDWMRHPDQRNERACIRPEISRTNTFGKIGASKGQFYEKHLKFIQLNSNFVPFTQTDLSYLIKENYDPVFVKTVYSAPLLTASQVISHGSPDEKIVRVQYEDSRQFKTYAKQLGLMDDLKSGVPRAGYRGVVSFFRDGRRVYLAPPPNWTRYDPTWS